MWERFLFYPFLHESADANLLNTPPVLYNILKSCVNYDIDFMQATPLKQLAEKTRGYVFYDTYPLSEKIDKATFEIDIINHFIERRIAFETFAMFQIKLINKLREIMPKYNMLFDLLDTGLEMLDNSYTLEREEDRINNGGYTNENEGGYNTKDDYIKKINTEEDLRNSDTPQNRIDEVKNGAYISEYNFNKGTEKDIKNQTINSTHTDDTVNTHHDTDDIDIRETKKYRENLIEKYKLIEDYQHIMSMIYRDLDILFYQIV